MRILIIGAMRSEIAELVTVLGAMKRGDLFGTGCFHAVSEGTEIFIVECGIGKVNAALATQRAVAEFAPDLIVNTGVAGSLKAENRIGDVIIGREYTYHDVSPAQMENGFPYQKSFFSDEGLVDLFKKVCEANVSERVVAGKIVSGEAFLNNSEDKRVISERYGADCVDMESAAIAHAAYVNKIPFIAVRSISDAADESAPLDFEAYVKENADISARCVLEFIKSRKSRS